MKEFVCVGRKGLVGYYKADDNNFYMFDFSNEPVSPVKVSTLPDNLDAATPYKPIHLSDEDIKQFENFLKSKMIEEFKEVTKEDKDISAVRYAQQRMAMVGTEIVNNYFQKVLVPSKIIFTADMFGRFYISAVAEVDGNLPTAWEGIEAQEDNCIVKRLPYREFATIEDFTDLSVPRFILIDKESTAKIEAVLQKYAPVDADDFRGHVLAALYLPSVYVEEFEDIKDIVEEAKKKEKDEKERRQKEFTKKKMDFMEKNRDKIDFICKYADRFDVMLPYYFELIKENNIEKLTEYNLQDLEINLDKFYKSIKSQYDKYTNPETVVFSPSNCKFKVTVGDIISSNGVVILPKEYAGLFIGKGGYNVKSLSKKLGIKIKVITT